MHKAVVRLFGVAIIALGALMMQGEARAVDFMIEPLDFDFPAEIEDAASDDKNLVVMFHQNGCPYCDKMRNRVYPHPKVSSLYNEKFVMIEVNVKGDLDVTTPKGEGMAEKEFAAKQRVRATPVFMFYGKQGEEALRLTGYQDPQMFVAAGRFVSSGAYKDGTSFLDFIRSGS